MTAMSPTYAVLNCNFDIISKIFDDLYTLEIDKSITGIMMRFYETARTALRTLRIYSSAIILVVRLICLYYFISIKF